MVNVRDEAARGAALLRKLRDERERAATGNPEHQERPAEDRDETTPEDRP
jgi:hypothetical protein